MERQKTEVYFDEPLEQIIRTILDKFDAVSSGLRYLEQRMRWMHEEIRLILSIVSKLKKDKETSK